VGGYQLPYCGSSSPHPDPPPRGGREKDVQGKVGVGLKANRALKLLPLTPALSPEAGEREKQASKTRPYFFAGIEWSQCISIS
jgi:hypothetical protein